MTTPDSQSALGGDISADQSTTTISISSPPPSSTLRQHQQPQSSPSGSNSSNDGSIEANNNNTVGQLAPLIKMANSDEHRKLQVQHQQKQKQQQVADGDMTSAAAPAQVQVEIKAQISSGGTAQIEAASPNDNPESLGHTIIECDPSPAAAAGGGGANERNGQPPVLAAEDVAVVSVAAAAPGQDSLHRSISVDVARDEEQQEQAPELSVVSVELTSANRQEQQQVQHKSNDEDVDELKSRRENKQEDTLSAGPDGSESEGAIKREETNNLRNQQQTLVAVATTAQDPTTLNNNKSISITSNNNKQSQHPPPPIKPICVSADHPARPYCKRRRLSYLQSLLLRKWPYLALAICTMSSLLFGMLLSALTVYMMHGVTNCSAAMAAVAAAAGAPSYAGSAAALEPRNRLPEFDTPLELASLEAVAAGGRQYAALSAPVAPASAGGGGSGDQQLVQKQGEQKPHFQRLPSSLWPQHYDLFIQPYIAEPFNFTGKVSIRILCKEPTDRISLHANDLQIDESKLRLEQVPKVNASSSSGGNTVPKVKGLSQDKQLQYAIVELDRELEVGVEYVIGIDFAGTLNDDLAGFYKIRYERPNSNETTWIAATQFQATDARRAFPCFDEPSYKATFSIQIKHWKNMTALSNMPIIDRQDSQDGLWVTDTFSKSQRMSTYLVAYAITNFESRSEGNISVWTRPGFAHTAEYALKIAGKILRHYEDFFGIEYPLPKMDMIALPDFNAGAMENWGLITYRETAMLFDESSSSIANKQRVAVVVAHELAHQWFGNLVTPKWWDDLWLNEGFASYVEYIGVDHVEPQWRMLDQFVVEEVQNVFRMDALSSSHQISIPVNNPDEISEIFDHISYAKGASIIRMMNHFLTEQVFKAGLRKYLRALKYSNAEQSDLWSHLTEVAAQIGPKENGVTPVDVERVMNSWTLQTGFPLVTLTREYGAEGKSQARAHLEQVRYQPYKSSQPANNSSVRSANTSVSLASSKPTQKWEIPITLTWKSEQNWSPNTRLWMHQNDSGPVELAANQVPKSDDEWMLLNVNQVGYYRVNYDQQNWKLLIEQLQQDHKQISTTNRAQILDDLFELARSGVIDYRFAMEATKYLRVERDYLPWDTVLMSFSYIDDMLQRSAIYGDWKDYISDLTRPYYARYKDAEWTKKLPTSSGDNGLAGNASEMGKSDVLEHYNMVNAIAWACQVDNHCIQKAKSIFSEWKQSGKNEINPALRYTTYCTAIENGNKSDWDFLWRVYEKEQNASERDRIMRALGCSKEIWILSRYLEWTFSKTKQIRRQDGAFVFRMIAKNNYGRDIAFNFLHERWATIKEFYGKTSFSMGNLVRSISTSMNTQVELNQLTTFYESIKHDVGTGKRSFQIAIEEVETNVLWRNRNYKILEEWLHSNMGKLPAMVAS